MSVHWTMNRRSALIGLAVSGLAPWVQAQPPTPQTAAQLFARFSALTGLEASFVETKKVALLRVPLKSQGTLYYARPGYLLRRVTSPNTSEVLITPERLELRDDRGSRTMDLRSRPDVKLFVESFIKVLAGDQAALEKAFVMNFTPAQNETQGPWVLTLTPMAAPLSQLIRKLTLTGNGYAVERIEVLETKGDSAVTELQVKNTGRVFTDEEKQRLFGIQPTTK